MPRALGTTDAVTTCECCGKSGLKLTVVMELDGGDIVHYGTTCASRNTGKTSKQINSEIRAEYDRKRAAASQEYRACAEYLAYRTRMAERDRLPWNDPRRLGRAAAEFVRSESLADDRARATIARKYGLGAYEIG